MKLDVDTLRRLGRIADRVGLIRRNPHWYEADPKVVDELRQAAERVEELLGRVKTIKAG
jgi:hypothetical protein